MENLSLESIRNKKAINQEKVLEEIKYEMVLNNVYYSKAKFACYSDGMLTYTYSNKNFLFEFTFICDDILLSKMTIKELLELKRIEYFDNVIFDIKTKEVIGRKSYTSKDQDEEIIEEVELTEQEMNKQVYKDLSKGIPEEDLYLGVYISNGLYLRSDGTFYEDN